MWKTSRTRRTFTGLLLSGFIFLALLLSSIFLVTTLFVSIAQSEVCDSGYREGELCTDDFDCPGECIGGANAWGQCANFTDCPNGCVGGFDNGQECSGVFSCRGKCTSGANPDGPCKYNSDCPDACVGGFDDKQECSGVFSCRGICAGGTNPGGPCKYNSDCPGGGNCGPLGSCTNYGNCGPLGSCTNYGNCGPLGSCESASCSGLGKCVESVVVTLSSFTTTPHDSYVLIEWETDMEIDNAGFNIHRNEQEGSGYTKINEFLIPAQGSGSYYSFADNDVINGTTYFYKLEDIDLYGVSTFHEPVSATPNEVVLLSPDDNAVLSSATPPTFEWASDSYTLFKLIFEGQKLRKYSTKGWISETSFTFSSDEWGSFVGKLGEGQTVFWSVKGKDVEGNKAQSETRSFTVE